MKTKKLLSLFAALILLLVPAAFADDTTTSVPTVPQINLPVVTVTPDSPIYGLKLFWENTIDSFVTDHNAQVDRANFRILERTAEANAMAANGNAGALATAQLNLAAKESIVQNMVQRDVTITADRKAQTANVIAAASSSIQSAKTAMSAPNAQSVAAPVVAVQTATASATAVQTAASISAQSSAPTVAPVTKTSAALNLLTRITSTIKTAISRGKK